MMSMMSRFSYDVDFLRAKDRLALGRRANDGLDVLVEDDDSDLKKEKEKRVYRPVG
jgi:hypothetical protein